jgi:glucoamylase
MGKSRRQGLLSICVIFMVPYIFLNLSMMVSASEESPASRGRVDLSKHSDRLSRHMKAQLSYSLDQILNNIVGANQILFDGPADQRGLPGAVLAAPSREWDPVRKEWQDYRKNWIRDAAITMRLVFRIMAKGELDYLPAERKMALAEAYVQFCERAQSIHFKDGKYDLGHALVMPDGKPNPNEWGYPQNDGPPLQVIALSEILHLMRELRIVDIPLQKLILTVMKRNIDYMVEHYDNPAVERWEEEKAQAHFSISVEMLRGLHTAYSSAEMFDPSLNARVALNPSILLPAMIDLASKIEERFIGAGVEFIPAKYYMIPDGSTVRNKASRLDMQVIMTSIAMNKYWEMNLPQVREDFIYPPSHPLMRATFDRLREDFRHRYNVNQYGVDSVSGLPLPGVLFGRYSEDTHFDGSPWFITTFAAIQYLLWDAVQIQVSPLVISNVDLPYFQHLDTGLDAKVLVPGVYAGNSEVRTKVRDALVRSAEEIFFRLMVHTGSEHSLTEVLKKVGGFKWGIHELTWSHVEFVKTKRMFERAQEEFGLKLSFNVNGPISSAVETAVLAVADEAVTVTAVAPPPPVEEASGPSGGQRSLCRMLIGRDGSAAGELGLAFAP